MFMTRFNSSYENFKEYISVISMHSILLFWIASRAAFLYALISPGMPSFIPPKYLTTTIKQLVNSFDLIWPKIGFPALFFGSPSSFTFSIDLSGLIMYA